MRTPLAALLAAFALFGLAVTGMAVGVLLQGKRLKGSCGGRGPDGRPLGDCLCSREEREQCELKPTVEKLRQQAREAALSGKI